MKRKQKQENIVGLLLQEIYSMIVPVYFAVILVMMPLYIYDRYYEMAFYKWKIYLFTTLIFMGITGLLGCVNLLLQLKRERTPVSIDWINVPVIFYGISVVITLITCGYPKAAWLGTDSWYMGSLAQLLFVGSFLLVANSKVNSKYVIGMVMAASLCCYIVGICQRLGWDFLHLYWEMEAEVLRDYLSTIGNRTWYSGYISVVYPIGVYLFWHGANRTGTLVTALYSFVAFGAIVTNNSDSIYFSVAAVFFGLFLMSIGSLQKLYRWMCVLVIWFLSCTSMAVLKLIFPDNSRVVRGVSKIFLNVRVMLIALVLVGIAAFGLRILVKKIQDRGKSGECSAGLRSKLRIGCILAVVLVGIFVVGLITANTTGMLQKYFGVTIQNNYFMFDNHWGDDRGFNWKITWQMFCELSPLQKLFGIGSDCYAFYGYSHPEYAGALNSFYGQSVTVTNAHNEWLNSLLCHGIVGGLLYFSVFVLVMTKCLKQSDSRQIHPLVPAVGLGVLGYMTHNVFCYQQICATGPMFLLMGIAIQKIKYGGRVQNELFR